MEFYFYVDEKIWQKFRLLNQENSPILFHIEEQNIFLNKSSIDLDLKEHFTISPTDCSITPIPLKKPTVYTEQIPQ